jgi:hypothetical protein
MRGQLRRDEADVCAEARGTGSALASGTSAEGGATIYRNPGFRLSPE